MSAKVVWSYKMPSGTNYIVYPDEASISKVCSCCGNTTYSGTICGEDNAKAFVDMMNAKEEDKK